VGLLIAGPADLDLEADALAADDDLLEDLAEPCLCEHPAGDHDPDGCRACACGARWDGLTPEDLEDDAEFETDVTRVVAFLKAARARRKRFDDERRDREAAGTATRGTIKPRVTNRKATAVEPKAPRAATTKPATARSKAITGKVVSSSLLPAEHSRAAWQDETEELLEVAGVLS
jgi:hypothetical protein